MNQKTLLLYTLAALGGCIDQRTVPDYRTPDASVDVSDSISGQSTPDAYRFEGADAGLLDDFDASDSHVSGTDVPGNSDAECDRVELRLAIDIRTLDGTTFYYSFAHNPDTNKFNNGNAVALVYSGKFYFNSFTADLGGRFSDNEGFELLRNLDLGAKLLSVPPKRNYRHDYVIEHPVVIRTPEDLERTLFGKYFEEGSPEDRAAYKSDYPELSERLFEPCFLPDDDPRLTFM